MTKSSFLADPDVNAMMAWVAERFEAPCGWTHGYFDRKTEVPWSCASLADAFRQYSWNGKPWTSNKSELDSYRRQLRAAVDARDIEAAFGACSLILLWGRVSANNGAYLTRRKRILLRELLHLSAVLEREHTPSERDLLLDPNDATSECRMNAGFVKIYSVLLDYCVIYDGRVGAALALLARQFCESTGRTTLPDYLAFACGTPKEGAHPKHRKNRDPSVKGLRFPRLRPDSRFHTEHTMRANWFLRGALKLNPRAFSAAEAGFHELAAGLFMVGYDLSEALSVTP